ncbi:glycoside hydrolase family 2 TIM barrel-domain containing protein [uncultured Vagococcus sp.]|uniref:glycoside hydrolase family 2 protein n=1 Tax=uncultured Vagococcus sp. TaxID=189676 RepID=UPI0028D0ACC5|nr:glycoside hydrolase family 2 TIM barrel-domain containing protein [uncultured Vagococcus sp.]
MSTLSSTHPRPQLTRKEWVMLDGEWSFKFDETDSGVKEQWYKNWLGSDIINVPFSYETELSGIHQEEFISIVWYRKEVELEEGQDYLLHFEGADHYSQVWIDGEKLGDHRGGYSRFSFQISGKKDKVSLVVRVEDTMLCSQPRGKQRWLKDNFGCWYIQTTGIWKSVWLEKVAANHISEIKLTPDVSQQTLACDIQLNHFDRQKNYHLISTISFQGNLISQTTSSLPQELSQISLSVVDRLDTAWGMRLWSPDEPNLYDLKVELLVDNQSVDLVDSYFGMRSIAIEGSTILLNGHSLYQRLILDQGYWQESGLTPPSVEALELDIMRIKEMGYNGVRKHQKTEDERFLYLCDKHGLLVWSEMASTYEFNDQAIELFTHEWLSIVKQNYNHPSIITWVPFNESWGIGNIYEDVKQQKFTESIYYLTKAIDSERPVITNDGWVHTISDIITLHDYEELIPLFNKRYEDRDKIMSNQLMFNKDFYAFARDYKYGGQPIIMSEFGGIAFNSKDGWGYGNQVADEEAFMKRFDEIHQAIQNLDYVSGYCYTQLTDVEQEVNGLLTPDRQPKVDLRKVKKVNERRKS